LGRVKPNPRFKRKLGFKIGEIGVRKEFTWATKKTNKLTIGWAQELEDLTKLFLQDCLTPNKKSLF